MSTTFEIGRWPAAIRRCLSHSGDGPIFTSSNTRAVKRRQTSGSISIDTWSVGASSPDGSASSSVGSGGERLAGDRVHLARDAVDREQVGPVRVDLELEHLVVTITSARPAARRPSSSSGRTMIPSWSSPTPTSSSARIMPLDLMPRSLASPSFVPSGMTAPGSATATVWPAATLGAPQTIVRGSPRPASTVQTLSRSAFGCCSAVRTLPITKRSGSPTPTRSIFSTSAVDEASRSASSLGGHAADRSSVRSQA